jgi:hypothetical protein
VTPKRNYYWHKGDAIKKVGTEARIDLEKFFSKKIHLNLFVKVKKDWRKMKETSKISDTDKTETQQLWLSFFIHKKNII